MPKMNKNILTDKVFHLMLFWDILYVQETIINLDLLKVVGEIFMQTQGTYHSRSTGIRFYVKEL